MSQKRSKKLFIQSALSVSVTSRVFVNSLCMSSLARSRVRLIDRV